MSHGSLMPGELSIPDETSTTSGASVLIALPTLSGFRPPARTTAELPRSRARSTAISLHGSALPVPPSRFSLRASRTMASAVSKSSSASGGMCVPAMRIAAQTSPPNARRIERTSVVVGSACSWTTSRRASSEMRAISAASLVPKTPTRFTPRVSPAPSRIPLAWLGETRRGPSAKTTPMQLAPASAASAVSWGRVMPQNLTFASTARPLDSNEHAHAGFRITRARQFRADEHRISAGLRETLHIGCRSYTALRYRHNVARDKWEQAERCLTIDRERFQIPVVHANQARVKRESELELFLAVDFQQDLQSVISSGLHQVLNTFRRYSARYDQRRR